MFAVPLPSLSGLIFDFLMNPHNRQVEQGPPLSDRCDKGVLFSTRLTCISIWRACNATDLELVLGGSIGVLKPDMLSRCCRRFLHPLHNFAIVSYDPSDLPQEARKEICAAEILPTPPLKRGDDVVLLGLTESLRVMKRGSIVTNATLALGIPCAEVPRFRAVHEEVLKLDQDFGSRFSGLITDKEGKVRALWGSYAEQVSAALSHLQTVVKAPLTLGLMVALMAPRKKGCVRWFTDCCAPGMSPMGSPALAIE